MDFYSFKLHQYAKHNQKFSLEERMAKAKKHVDKENAKEYEDVLSKYESALRCNLASMGVDSLSYSRVVNEMYQDRLVQAVSKAKQISVLSPEEYFLHLSQQESQAVALHAEEKQAEYNDAVTSLDNLNSGLGISAKVAAFLGKKEEMTTNLESKVQLDSARLEVAISSSQAWENLSFEEQTEYLLGRIEYDGITQFDAQGMDRFAGSVATIKKEQAMATEVFEQTTLPGFHEQ